MSNFVADLVGDLFQFFGLSLYFGGQSVEVFIEPPPCYIACLTDGSNVGTRSPDTDLFVISEAPAKERFQHFLRGR